MKRDEFYYLPRPNESSPWDIEILGAGQSNIGPNQPYPFKIHPTGYHFNWDKGRTLTGYQLVYVTHGSGKIETSQTPVRDIQAPFLFLLFPNIWHRYRPTQERGWQERWVGFDGSLPNHQCGCFILYSDDLDCISISKPLFGLVLWSIW